MQPTQPTPLQDAIAVYAHRHPGRTMVQVAKGVCPSRSIRDARAAIRRAERNGRVELRPNPSHKGSYLVFPGPVPSVAESNAVSWVGSREKVILSGRYLLTPAEVRRLRSLFRREAKAIRAYHRGRSDAKARLEHIHAKQREIISKARERGPNPVFQARQKAAMQAMLARAEMERAEKRAARAALSSGTARKRTRRRKPALRKSPLELR